MARQAVMGRLLAETCNVWRGTRDFSKLLVSVRELDQTILTDIISTFVSVSLLRVVVG